MPEDLWQIRKRKGLSVGQLASKSGLSAQLIGEYEAGKPIPAGDRFKLAKALYIFDRDIKPISTPPPASIKPPVENKPKPEKPVAPPPVETPPLAALPLAKPVKPKAPPEPKIPTKRAALPEGVDQYEFDYLTAAQQAQAALTVKLFNGEVITGTLIGFSTYALMLRLDDGSELAVQKLAIVYYQRAGGQP